MAQTLVAIIAVVNLVMAVLALITQVQSPVPKDTRVIYGRGLARGVTLATSINALLLIALALMLR